MMDTETKSIQGSETGRVHCTGSNFQEVEKGGDLPVLDEVVLMPSKPVQPDNFKRGVFGWVSCLYRKNLAGEFETYAPHIGVVNSHKTTPQDFGRWLNTFRTKRN